MAAPSEPPTPRVFAPRKDLADRAVGGEGARRPSGGEEGEAACRGRCGGGPASPADKKQRGRETVPDWATGDARADESTEQLLAAFRRRIDAKIQADLAEEDRVAQALRQQLLTTLRGEISKARDQGLSGRIWLFGSFAWGQPGPSSDIDVLVEGDDGSVARLIAETTGPEVHAIKVDEAPATLVDRVVTEGILL